MNPYKVKLQAIPNPVGPSGSMLIKKGGNYMSFPDSASGVPDKLWLYKAAKDGGTNWENREEIKMTPEMQEKYLEMMLFNNFPIRKPRSI